MTVSYYVSMYCTSISETFHLLMLDDWLLPDDDMTVMYISATKVMHDFYKKVENFSDRCRQWFFYLYKIRKFVIYLLQLSIWNVR